MDTSVLGVSPDFHAGVLHLNPLIQLIIKPDTSHTVPTVKVRIVTVFIPPTAGIKLGTMGTAHIIVRVHGTECHVVGIF